MPCDECDPSFSCFDGSDICRKKPMTQITLADVQCGEDKRCRRPRNHDGPHADGVQEYLTGERGCFDISEYVPPVEEP